ncbi:MAG TPA: DJ-1/PfpI family protein [Acidimicrobiales bacterium]
MQIAIGLYPGFAALDAIGPYQVFTGIPGAEVVVCAAQAGRLDDDAGLLHFDIEHTFADVPTPDLLLVPGGYVTRTLAANGDPIVDWIREAHPHTTYTTSVCTGALLLGAAGLLKGLRATTHWVAYDELREYGAEPTEQRVVFEGRIVTGAGVSAGIDLALAIAGKLAGPEVAQAIQLGIEYDPQPPYDAGAPSKVTPEIRDLVQSYISQAAN